MTVINPNSISGITSITLPSGGDNVLTIHTNDGIERFRIDSSGNVKVGSAATISPDGDVFFTGVCTATTLAGAASGLTGALPALDGSALTGVASTENIRTNTNATFLQNVNVSGSTTTGTTIVGGGVTISESGIEASGIGITCANINGTKISGRRNILINGAMNVAQYGTSSTTAGYYTIDRFQSGYGNFGINMTQSQQSLSSSDTGPYGEGFRKYKRAQLASNAFATANANAYVEAATYKVEAQDLANSGWDPASATNFITLSFWFRCSTNQTFLLNLRSEDGTSRMFSTTFTASANNTWTKIVKTIPGSASPTVAIDNDNGSGLAIFWVPYYGADYTDSGSTMDAWKTYSGSSQGTDMASTWLTAGASTFDITGVQLEVGSQATAFEHRSYGDDLALCQRYFYMHAFTSNHSSSAPADSSAVGIAVRYSQTSFFGAIFFPVQMRATPSFFKSTGTDHFILLKEGSNDSFNDIAVQDMGINSAIVNYYDGINNSSPCGWVQIENGYDGYIGFTAEL